MVVFHFAELGKLKYVHNFTDKYSGFQFATTLSPDKSDSVIPSTCIRSYGHHWDTSSN